MDQRSPHASRQRCTKTTPKGTRLLKELPQGTHYVQETTSALHAPPTQPQILASTPGDKPQEARPGSSKERQRAEGHAGNSNGRPGQ